LTRNHSFLGVQELLSLSVDKTKDLLEQELKIRLGRVTGKMALHFAGKNLLRRKDLQGTGEKT
jgi:hypothetical protein